MAKDKLDRYTKGDLVPKKIGRPTVYLGYGPMNSQERQERFREGKKLVQIKMTEAQLKKLKKYCARHDITRHDLISSMIKQLRIDIPPDA